MPKRASADAGGISRNEARKREVLHSIVRCFIETGEPVASRTISKARRDLLSPASIRNIMADLCEEGYLSQPHTSAGRVPTAKAFESFVRSLARGRMLTDQLHRLRAELSPLATMEARVERSSHMLTEMTRSVGIAAAIPATNQTLDRIELLQLDSQRVLMIVVMGNRHITNRMIALEEPMTADELQSIRNYINRNFSGWNLPEIHVELRRRLEKESAAYDVLLRRLTQLYAKGLLDVGQLPEVYLDGTSYLVGLDLHLTREKLRELFRTLEEKKRILMLLDRFMEQPIGEVAVKVGLEEAHPSMHELSLIGICVPLEGGLSAKIAVLGPMRMNYEKAISAVMHLGQAFQGLPS